MKREKGRENVHHLRGGNRKNSPRRQVKIIDEK